MSSAVSDRKPASASAVVPALPLSTLGAKAILALSGLLMALFLIGHLIGNLLLFKGQDAINNYAKFLKDLGPLLWIARIVLLSLFVAHVVLAIQLVRRSQAARPVKYVREATIQASTASKYMIHTGLIVLFFVALHVAHYTLGWIGSANGKNYLELHDAVGRHDVYSMVIAGFSNPFFSVVYIVCQIALGFHLYHGATSLFQTLGINHVRYNPIIRRIGLIMALFIAGGNLIIILSVWMGLVK